MQTDLRIGIDIGGTFTDFVIYDPVRGFLRSHKELSTPGDPAQAVLSGLERLGVFQPGDPARSMMILHGSTVATNALLERKGARTALIATVGFRDMLQIGRQNRPALYDFNADPPPPLVPDELRFEVDERVDARGSVLRALDIDQCESVFKALARLDVESVSICLLFSFLHPDHERAIGDRMRGMGFNVSLSSEILPEYREYERASTTAVNAYVSPILERYLAQLEQGVAAMSKATTLRVMQSNGGNISVGEARRNGVRCILSGPAGGVVGAQYIAEQAFRTSRLDENPDQLKLITFDMGGTSTDVSLIDGTPQVTTEAVVGGCPIRVPVLDIHTIGAGGGSLARLDAGGALRVGPESAGADPGPACYGKGELPTVTDANLVLGRLAPEYFLGGQMPLDEGRARRAMDLLGQKMGMDRYNTALGVIEVANAHMERALRLISVERGYDPREFTLLSFGGAGGLHAADLARRLGIPRVLIPPMASTLSAFGMLAADVVKDYTQTVMLPGDTHFSQVQKHIMPLVRRGEQEVQAEGVHEHDIQVDCFLDMRYVGQSYELTIPFSQGYLEDFHDRHRQVYGYARAESPIEIVNLRVRAVGKIIPPPLAIQPSVTSEALPTPMEIRPVYFRSDSSQAVKKDSLQVMPTPFYRGEDLQSGNRIFGPAEIVRADTTILVGQVDLADVDGFGNVWIKVGA